MPLDKDKLLRLVASGKTQEAIDEILAHREEIPEELYLEVVTLSSDLAKNASAQRSGTLSEDVLRVQRNQVSQSLIQIIKALGRPAPGEGRGASPQRPAEEAQARPSVGKLSETISFVVAQFFRRPLRFKFLNWIALLLAAPFVLAQASGLFEWENARLWLVSLYSSPYFWIAAGFLLAAALVSAVRGILKGYAPPPSIEYSKNSPVKGLRAFDFEDAEIFKELQRQQDIETCLQGLAEKDYRFGVLAGESGSGKTSFLRAGLHAALEANGIACVVAKLRNEPPLASIRQALRDQLNTGREPPEGASLREMLEFYRESSRVKELVLVLDQFEQFFTQQKTEESRRPFIGQLNECYQSLPQVKVLVSLRKDFQGYLFEVQDVLGYSLTARRNYFNLQKFTPAQATEIFKVMAKAEGLAFDTGFVFDMCKEELASEDDGLISAVDIQILAFIIKGQQLEDKAFTRQAFQKMGGIEGLMQRFLQEQLDAPNRYNQDQAALKVLLAFVDLSNNVRAGELPPAELLPRVAQPMNQPELLAILDWLEGLRLITRTEAKGKAPHYELAHERLIPPLRNLAGKSLSEAGQANILLERRTNEWIANDKKRRFLLSWGEYRNILSNEKLLAWGRNEAAKRELVRVSGRKFQWNMGLVIGLALLTLAGWWFNHQNEEISRLLAGAEAHILALEYDAAKDKLWEAGQIGWRRKAAGRSLMEVAFYYNEIGELQRAVGITDSVSTLLSNGEAEQLIREAEADPSQAQALLRDALRSFDNYRYDSILMRRYFPDMVSVKGGTFQLGCLANNCDTSRYSFVTVSDFLMARTETTVWQYEVYARATGREQEKVEDWKWMGNTPAVMVSWYDAIAYANWASERLGKAPAYQLDSIPGDPNEMDADSSIVWEKVINWEADGFRLPTDAEWEYAARGGIRQDTFEYSGNDTIGLVAWYGDNVGLEAPFNRTHPVATKAGNGLGIYDMSGNVWEWCWDETEDFLGTSRVVRGGAWYFNAGYCRLAPRSDGDPRYRYDNYGFRLVVFVP